MLCLTIGRKRDFSYHALREGGTPVRDQLLLLLKIQEIDNEITEVEDAREEIPSLLEKLEDRLTDKRKSQTAKESQISDLNAQLAEKQRLMDLEKIKIKNTKNKESALQNIREYEAFTKEVETHETTVEEIDGAVKELKGKLGSAENELLDLQSDIEQIVAEVKETKQELEGRLVDFDQTLDRLYDQRDNVADRIDEGLYYKYERLLERLDGVAVAEADHYACQACNMAIPPQTFNELMKGNRLITCANCLRILVYRDPEASVE